MLSLPIRIAVDLYDTNKVYHHEKADIRDDVLQPAFTMIDR
jgi:hypothetical protein